MTSLTSDQLAEFEQTLKDRRDELEQADALSHDSRLPVELDQTSVGRLSRVDAMQRQAMACAARARRQNEARMIAAALDRIATNDFGWCDGCGEPIPLPRLRLDAAIVTCIECAR